MPYSSSRSASPFFVVIHTGEGILNRHDMARFLDNNPEASAHAAADAGGVVAPLVPYDRAAWTAGPTANSYGLHIELCAFAAMNRDHWLSESDVTVWIPWLNANRTIRSPYSMLRHAAAWTRDMCIKYGITVRKVSAADLRADQDGICGHADTSYAWGETDHTDPGPQFPWDAFISLVKGGNPPPSSGGGSTAPPAEAPKPATSWPLPAGHYFGDITGPDEEHGGVSPQEQAWVRQLQQALIRKGHVPGVSDPNSQWADGLFEQATTDAVKRWQGSVSRPQSGDLHKEDWESLVLDRPVSGGGTPQPAPQPQPSPPVSSVPPFPLPSGHYFGDINGPTESHGGYYQHERGWVRQIQQALIRKGYVPGISDPNSGWADGLYEQETIDAVSRFQRAEMPGTEFYGQVWWDDWAKLLS